MDSGNFSFSVLVDRQMNYITVTKETARELAFPMGGRAASASERDEGSRRANERLLIVKSLSLNERLRCLRLPPEGEAVERMRD